MLFWYIMAEIIAAVVIALFNIAVPILLGIVATLEVIAAVGAVSRIVANIVAVATAPYLCLAVDALTLGQFCHCIMSAATFNATG